jgi:hydroxyacylglutathione hydrolase
LTHFIGGCGKFFEGTADQMNNALNNIISKRPDNTLIYCGHEYTISNLNFAISVDPHNESLQVYFLIF